MLDRWTDRVPPWHGDLTTLREVNATDVYSLFTLFSDPAVTTYMAPPPPTLAKITRVVLPIHLWKARKNEYGASNPCKKLISAPLMREFFDCRFIGAISRSNFAKAVTGAPCDVTHWPQRGRPVDVLFPWG